MKPSSDNLKIAALPLRLADLIVRASPPTDSKLVGFARAFTALRTMSKPDLAISVWCAASYTVVNVALSPILKDTTSEEIDAIYGVPTMKAEGKTDEEIRQTIAALQSSPTHRDKVNALILRKLYTTGLLNLASFFGQHLFLVLGIRMIVGCDPTSKWSGALKAANVSNFTRSLFDGILWRILARVVHGFVVSLASAPVLEKFSWLIAEASVYPIETFAYRKMLSVPESRSMKSLWEDSWPIGLSMILVQNLSYLVGLFSRKN